MVQGGGSCTLIHLLLTILDIATSALLRRNLCVGPFRQSLFARALAGPSSGHFGGMSFLQGWRLQTSHPAPGLGDGLRAKRYILLWVKTRCLTGSGWCGAQVHGVDVEGMQLGIDEELVALLGRWSPVPVTYAGGARTLVTTPTLWFCDFKTPKLYNSP